MCEKCKELVECPIGEKRRVLVEKSDKIITDFYGHKYIDDGLRMFVDKYKSGYVECAISRHYYNEDNVWYGAGIDIQYCPFCGEKLY